MKKNIFLFVLLIGNAIFGMAPGIDEEDFPALEAAEEGKLSSDITVSAEAAEEGKLSPATVSAEMIERLREQVGEKKTLRRSISDEISGGETPTSNQFTKQIDITDLTEKDKRALLIALQDINQKFDLHAQDQMLTILLYNTKNLQERRRRSKIYIKTGIGAFCVVVVATLNTIAHWPQIEESLGSSES